MGLERLRLFDKTNDLRFTKLNNPDDDMLLVLLLLSDFRSLCLGRRDIAPLDLLGFYVFGKQDRLREFFTSVLPQFPELSRFRFSDYSAAFEDNLLGYAVLLSCQPSQFQRKAASGDNRRWLSPHMARLARPLAV